MVLRRDPLRWVDFERARLELARLKIEDRDAVPVLFARAAEICSRALRVERVGIWSLEPSLSGLLCVHLLDRRAPGAPAGGVLRHADLGRYARALIERRFIASADVRSDPQTADLVEEYFAPLGVVSTLDVPLYRGGEVIGVLCHEHRGELRAWTDEEGAFAISVADMLAHALTAAELAEAQEALNAMEHARQEALRAEALARVARGLAHDLGNSLQSILAQAEFLMRVADDPAQVREAARSIRDLGAHAGRITAGMREFARGVDAAPRVVELDAQVRSSIEALRALAGTDREFSSSLGADGAQVAIDPTGFERVLANLVVNAREATEAGGSIMLSTRALDGEVEVELRDDGQGMDEATRSRVFEPFFTTHGEVPQRGFGLAIVAAVVHAAGGEVSVESAPGEGASFRIRLPLVEAPAPGDAEAISATTGSRVSAR